MARREADREDLLREATGLVARVELQLPPAAESVVIGFRRSGCGSIYWGADPVLQFNTAGELRRGYRGGFLLKAEQGRLVELARQRSETATVLESRALTNAEQAAVLSEWTRLVERLRADLAGDGWKVVGQVPEGEDLAGRVREWLDGLPRPLKVAPRPHAG